MDFFSVLSIDDEQITVQHAGQGHRYSFFRFPGVAGLSDGSITPGRGPEHDAQQFQDEARAFAEREMSTYAQ